MGRSNVLGWTVHDLLKKKGIETPGASVERTDPRKDMIEANLYDMMGELGLDLYDDSMKDTPKRVAKMYCDEIFYGLNYERFPACTNIENKMKVDEMVAHKATVMSVCEHHFVPFMGFAFIGYIPGTKVIGLSKMNRIVDFFSRRPQVQERLTVQIHAALSHILETEDVAVVCQAEHLCVKLRGIKDASSYTTTSKMGGRFMSVPALRQEFLALAHNGR